MVHRRGSFDFDPCHSHNVFLTDFRSTLKSLIAERQKIECLSLKFVAIAFSKNAGSTAKEKNLIAIHEYNNVTGEIKMPAISKLHNGTVSDDILFAPDDSYLIISDQGNHAVNFHSFDKTSGTLENDYFFQLKNPEAKLSFNHGMGLSTNKKYLAVANYGTDTCNIYQIAQ